MSNAQITQLIDNLRNPDLSTRLDSFRKLHLISAALGVARTRGELVPYLAEFCDDDDEVLIILASMLGEMVDAVGGPEHAYVLLHPLEQLAGSEETAVRDKAVASISKVSESMNAQAIIEHMMPLVRRCADADWFTGRISATALCAGVYARLPNTAEGENLKKELRTLYANLCKKEETPMVKRAAAANLGAFASMLDSAVLLSDFHNLLVKLSRDEIDSVRLLVVQSCVQIAKVYVASKDPNSRAENIANMKPIILSLADDSSWRVRYMLADKFIELCATLNTTPGANPSASSSNHVPASTGVGSMQMQSTPPTTSAAAASILNAPIYFPSTPLQDDDLISCFIRLLDDPELEVRTSATRKVGEFARLLGVNKTMEKLFWVDAATGKPLDPPPSIVRNSPLQSIISNQTSYSLHTKSALASVILQFVPVLTTPSSTDGSGSGSAATSNNSLVIEHLLPILLSLLNDEHAEVRLALIAKLGEEAQAQAQASTSHDGSSSVGERSILSMDVLSTSLLPALAKLSSDSKWRIRLQTIQLLPAIASYFSPQFFQAKLFDLVLSWLGDSIWSIREAAIATLVKLTHQFGREWARTQLLPQIKQLAADKSYVFRMAAVFALKELAQPVGAEIVTHDLTPLITQTLSKDAVPNVRFNVARLVGYLVKEGLILTTNSNDQNVKNSDGMNTVGGSSTSPSPSSPLSMAEHALMMMKDDPDVDVRYCATVALKEAFGRSV